MPSPQVQPLGVFRYIYSKPGGTNALEDKYNRISDLKNLFTVAEEYSDSERTKYRYLVFADIDHYSQYVEQLPEDDRHCHEVIFGWMPQKIKFDIDHSCDMNDLVEQSAFMELALGSIIETIKSQFFIEYKIVDPDIIVMSSSGYIEDSTRYKFSYHIVVNGYYVADATDACEFMRRFLHVLPMQYCSIIDQGVNKQLQNFRLYGCSKLGSTRVKSMNDPGESDIYTLHDTVVQFVEGCARLPTLANTARNTPPVAVTQFDLAEILRLVTVAGYDAGHEFNMINNGVVCYNRISPSHCKICERVHESDNTLMAFAFQQDDLYRVYVKCRHNASANRYVGAFHCAAERAVIANDGQRKRAIDIVSNAIARDLDFPDKQLVMSIPDANVYDEPTLRDFEHTDTLCVLAGMKMGKTKKLMEYIAQHFEDTDIRRNSIKFISFRQTFSANIKERFPDFTLYSDVQGYSLNQLRLIVQVESLHRLDITPNTPIPDLLVLDEVELILDQFNSGLMRQFNKTWATFSWLLKTARHVVCMDATLSDRTIRVLANMRHSSAPERKMFLHWNTHANAADDNYLFTTSKQEFYAQLYSDIDAGKKIALPTSSLAFAEAAKQALSEKYPNLSIGYYSSKTSAAVKREHFNNVDEWWSIYDVLIYTPTVSAGISFEREHFDRVYGWFSDVSCAAEVCIQMLGRIRDVREKTYIIGVELTGGNFPTDIDVIKHRIYQSRENLFKTLDDSMLQFEYTEAGAIRYYETDYFKLLLENIKVRNLSRNNFIGRFACYLASYGATMSILDSTADQEALTAIQQRLLAVKQELVAKSNIEIANSSEICTGEIAAIAEKFISGDEVTDADARRYDRYKLRRDYNFGGVIDAQFVRQYNSRQCRMAYRNLTKIMRHADLKTSLDAIRIEERDHYVHVMEYESGTYANQDLSRKYLYDNHRIAVTLINLFGWDSLVDPQPQTAQQMYDALHPNSMTIFHMLLENYHLFDIHRPRLYMFKQVDEEDQISYLRNAIGYMNRILSKMYKVRIKYIKSAGIFVLATSKLFSYTQNHNGSIPNLFDVWQPPDVIEQKNQTVAPFTLTWRDILMPVNA